METLTRLLDELETTVKREEENKIAENAIIANNEVNNTTSTEGE